MNEGQRNYNVCFAVFSTLMGCALLVRFLSGANLVNFLQPMAELMKYPEFCNHSELFKDDT